MLAEDMKLIKTIKQHIFSAAVNANNKEVSVWSESNKEAKIPPKIRINKSFRPKLK